MKKKNGFTLVEVLVVVAILAVITAIGIPVFMNVRNNVLKSQFENVKSRIETAAEDYANDTQIITVSVAKLIEDGYLKPDDQTDIYNPVDNESLNCRIVEVSVDNGEYNAKLTNNGTLENGVCSAYDIKVSNLIKASCYSKSDDSIELAKCEESYKNTNNKWYSGSVKLNAVAIDGKNITSYRWSSLIGETSNEQEMILTTDNVKSTTYNLSLTYEDGTSASDSLVINIDNEVPTIIDIVKDDNWAGGNKKVSINASDGVGSGVSSYYVGTDNSCPGASFTTKNEFSLTEGTYYACVKDNSGNVSVAKEFIIDKIDTTKPNAELLNGSYFETYSKTMGITYYSELTRKITFVDEESIMAQVKYCFTDKDKCEPTELATIKQGTKAEALFSYPAKKNATRVCVKGIDSVGNESDLYCDDTFLVDTTAPTNVTATHSTNHSSQINVNGEDRESNINKYVCHYGTSSVNLNNSVVANGTTCDIGRLSSGVTYYVRVDAYNNANLVTSSNVINFEAKVTVEDAYKEICGNGEYCNNPYYVNYNNNIFVIYRNNNGYKAIYNGVDSNSAYLQTSCCNNGHCTYSGSQYTNGVLSNYLNNSFINRLPYYSSKLNRATWYTGVRGSVTSRVATAYVGLMDYNEYQNTRGKNWVYSGAYGQYFWLLTPASTSSYIENITIMYNGSYHESQSVVNTKSGVRPVISLRGDIVFTGGDGSINNPYRVL